MGHFLSRNGQKRPKNDNKAGEFQTGQKKFASKQKFNLIMILKPKILEFYYTFRKTWHFDILGEIGPKKLGPNFDRSDFTLNFKMPSFPESMIKFKYIWLEIHCQTRFLSLGKFFWPIWKKLLNSPLIDSCNQKIDFFK